MNAAEARRLLGVSPVATEVDIRAAWRRLAFERHPDRGGDEVAMQELNRAVELALAALGAPPRPQAEPGMRPHVRGHHRRVERDQPSFVVELLPVAAFEALLVVATWIGEVLVDEPPYLLEVHLREPVESWCRLELVPDAGSSTVSLTVDGPVAAEDVRDLWIAQLNQLGEWDPDG